MLPYLPGEGAMNHNVVSEFPFFPTENTNVGEKHHMGVSLLKVVHGVHLKLTPKLEEGRGHSN